MVFLFLLKIDQPSSEQFVEEKSEEKSPESEKKETD